MCEELIGKRVDIYDLGEKFKEKYFFISDCLKEDPSITGIMRGIFDSAAERDAFAEVCGTEFKGPIALWDSVRRSGRYRIENFDVVQDLMTIV